VTCGGNDDGGCPTRRCRLSHDPGVGCGQDRGESPAFCLGLVELVLRGDLGHAEDGRRRDRHHPRGPGQARNPSRVGSWPSAGDGGRLAVGDWECLAGARHGREYPVPQPRRRDEGDRHREPGRRLREPAHLVGAGLASVQMVLEPVTLRPAPP